MNKLNGNLGMTSLPEILRLCSVQQKTGTLNLSRDKINKKLYFNKGKLIYITSNKTGERVGEYLIQRGELTRSWAGFLLKDSQRNGIAFTQSLLQKNIFEKDKLQKALSELATLALADVISWTSGNFEFSDNLPQQALDGPIQISEADALQMALKSGKDTSKADNTDQILRDLARKIAGDKFVPPILPKTASKLQTYWEDKETVTEKVLAFAHKNQTLTANLLRVVNAAVGCPEQKCTTLKQAMELYPHEQLLGMIHAQVVNAHPPKQPDTVSQMLQHALRCACLAEQIAVQMGENEEEAYTCGLLHNIGKILLLQLLTHDNIPDNQLPKLIQKFHQNSGALLSRRWNLAPQLYECIKHYHMPQQAKESAILVEIVHLSHNLLITRGDEENYKEQCPHIDFDRLDIDSLINGLDLIDELVDATY